MRPKCNSEGGQIPTIAAIASPPGGGLRGILRLSGPRSSDIVRAVWASSPPPDLASRALLVGRFGDGRGEQPLLLLWMPGPRSFTREDVAEFHLPGSPPLLRAALGRVLDLGAVPAAPGEFTRRAFLSGRIDLTRAEGVLALVSARNEGERRAGMALLSGGLGGRVERVRGRLEELRALVEGSLDFDARDTGHVAEEEIERLAKDAQGGLAEASAWEASRARGGGEPRIALVGAPNAGKSALYNRLLGHREKEGAIVAPDPGTTRDALEAGLELEGIACRLYDTAGIASGSSPGSVAARAQEATQRTIDACDLKVWVVDAASPDPGPAIAKGADVLLVWNKVDLSEAPPAPPADLAAGLVWIATSAATGAGLDALRKAAAAALESESAGAGLARELAARHERALAEAAQALERGISGWRSGAPLELLAEELRLSTEVLDEVTGRTTAEAVLDRIFARFCLGK